MFPCQLLKPIFGILLHFNRNIFYEDVCRHLDIFFTVAACQQVFAQVSFGVMWNSKVNTTGLQMTITSIKSCFKCERHESIIMTQILLNINTIFMFLCITFAA